MAEYLVEGGIRGWGQEIPPLLQAELIVANRAVPGATAESFKADSWSDVKRLGARWIVFQFGHNPGATDRESKALSAMIQEARHLGAIPILVAPMAGRDKALLLPPLDSTVRSVATAMDAPLVRLDSLSLVRWTPMSQDSIRMIFLDYIHLTPLGAKLVASLIAPGLNDAIEDNP